MRQASVKIICDICKEEITDKQYYISHDYSGVDAHADCFNKLPVHALVKLLNLDITVERGKDGPATTHSEASNYHYGNRMTRLSDAEWLSFVTRTQKEKNYDERI